MTATTTNGTKPRYRVGNIPSEHRAIDRWVRFECLRNSKGKLSKEPYIPGTRRMASHSDASTWRPFDEALADAELRGAHIGFAFGPDIPYVFFDLDNVVGAHGVVREHATLLVDTLDTYTEVSAGGSGLHIICAGVLPPRCGRPAFWPKGTPFEAYPKRGGRFCVFTGDTRPGLGSLYGLVEERSDVLAALMPTRKAKPSNGSTSSAGYAGPAGTLADDEAEFIITWAGPFWTDGRRHHMALHLSGELARKGVARDQAVAIIERCATNDGDPGAKVDACEDTFDALEDGEDISGWYGLKDLCGLSDEDLAPLSDILDRFWQRNQRTVTIVTGGLRARPARLRVREVRRA